MVLLLLLLLLVVMIVSRDCCRVLLAVDVRGGNDEDVVGT